MKSFMYIILVFVLFSVVSLLNMNEVLARGAREVEELIESLEAGEPVYYENLTLIPLYTRRLRDLTRYTTLEEALRNKWLKVEELEGGRVPQVRLSNRSNKYIYIMGGEILTGCKQDRIVGRDVLIKPKSKNIVVPVYCVEQRRWHSESGEFYTKQNLGTSYLRAEAQRGRQDAQQNIWDEISKGIRKNKVKSETSAYQDIYEAEEVQRKIIPYERYMQRIPQLYEDTIGIVVGVGGEIVSVDIFVNPDLFNKLWPKLLKSCALSAITCDTYGSITQDDAVRFLRKLHNKRYVQKSAIDLGFEFYAADSGVNVNALVYRNAVIHLAGFSQEEKIEGYKRNHNYERRIPIMMRP